MIFRSFVFSAFVCTVLLSNWAEAQQEEDKEKKRFYNFALQTGPLLPNQIDGITEIMPTWNASFGFPYRKGQTELRGGASKGNGVTMYNLALSFRGEATLDDLIAIFYAGIDSHYYYPINNVPPIMAGGGHVGGGFLALIGDNVYFRSDMKFNVTPGTALYVGFGIETRWPAGGEEGASDGK